MTLPVLRTCPPYFLFLQPPCLVHHQSSRCTFRTTQAPPALPLSVPGLSLSTVDIFGGGGRAVIFCRERPEHYRMWRLSPGPTHCKPAAPTLRQ